MMELICRFEFLTQIHGCLRASAANILLAGFSDNMLMIRLFASRVTVSHSGEGNWKNVNMESGNL